jgi:hypothetical protein
MQSIHFMAATSLALSQPVKAEDVLRLTKADQLHGCFQGIDDQGKIEWQRRDLNQNSLYSATEVRSIVLGTDLKQNSVEYSYLRLKNGDIIPGEVVHLTDKTLKIHGRIIGDLEIPREHVREICPAPFGGSIHYAGPYSADGWRVLYPSDNEQSETSADQEKATPQVHGDPSQVKDGAIDAKEAPTKATETVKSKDDKHWKHIGTSWYRKDSSLTLIRKECLPSSSLLRFRAKWLSRINLNIVLHADFMSPPSKKEENENGEGDAKKNAANAMAGGVMFHNNNQQMHLPSLGNAIVLNIYQSYLSLSRVGYKKNGEFFVNRLTQAPSALQLEESGESIFEIRSDIAAGLMMLFVDGKYAAQWEKLDESDDLELEDSAKMLPLGNGIGFQVAGNKLPIRINDIVISDWNGVRDPARSFSHEKRDILLLSNGMDRYSGKLDSINEGTAVFQSSLGTLQIPLAELSEIHFAGSDDDTSHVETASSIGVSFFPIGKISGQPVRANRKQIQLKHPMVGDLQLKLDQALMLHFSDENSFIDELVVDDKPLEIPEE